MQSDCTGNEDSKVSRSMNFKTKKITTRLPIIVPAIRQPIEQQPSALDHRRPRI